MTVRPASSVLVSVVLAAFLTPAAAAQSGAKALFHGPAASCANPFAAVGIQYWMTDKSPEGGIPLIPDRVWPGFLMEPRHDYAIPGAITVPAAGSDTRVLILFARSQTEQVRTSAGAREKIRWLSMAVARDGALAIKRHSTFSRIRLGMPTVNRGDPPVNCMKARHVTAFQMCPP